jgi:hypothetical protein
MNPEALKHRTAVSEARVKYAAGELTQDELHAVVDEYIAFIASKIGKAKAKRFTRSYILRAL